MLSTVLDNVVEDVELDLPCRFWFGMLVLALEQDNSPVSIPDTSKISVPVDVAHKHLASIKDAGHISGYKLTENSLEFSF